MEGMGSVATFPAIGMDPATAYMLKDMLDAEAGYELAGFVWFQWYNDCIGGGYSLLD
jgi:hypothetical protein